MGTESSKKPKQWSKKESWMILISSVFGAILFTAALAGIIFSGDNKGEPQTVTPQEEKRGQPEIQTATEEIKFETTEQDDPTLEKGQTKVKQEGKNGEKEVQYAVTYVNGTETSREKLSEKIISEPVKKIVLIGTKEKTPTCGADYYLNVDGNCVHRPSNDCNGATAKCRDGTCSYSQHRRGTCSSHGGVAEWL